MGIARCCARAASGHAAAAPPNAASNSRRLMVTVIRPSRARCVKERIPRLQRAVFTFEEAGCWLRPPQSPALTTLLPPPALREGPSWLSGGLTRPPPRAALPSRGAASVGPPCAAGFWNGRLRFRPGRDASRRGPAWTAVARPPCRGQRIPRCASWRRRCSDNRHRRAGDDVPAWRVSVSSPRVRWGYVAAPPPTRGVGRIGDDDVTAAVERPRARPRARCPNR